MRRPGWWRTASVLLACVVTLGVLVTSVRFVLLRAGDLGDDLSRGPAFFGVLVGVQIAMLGLAEGAAALHRTTESRAAVMAAIAVVLFVEGSYFALSLNEAGVLFTLGLPGLLGAAFAFVESENWTRSARLAALLSIGGIALIGAGFAMARSLCNCRAG